VDVLLVDVNYDIGQAKHHFDYLFTIKKLKDESIPA